MNQRGGHSLEPPSPAQANTPAEFVSALRALRTWSGLTYRQLEGKAGAHRDTLPASTIATTLGRPTLPKERFVDAFTRACGLGDDTTREWLDARHRIAISDPALTDDEDKDDDPPPAPRSPRWRLVVALVAAAGVGAGAALGGVALFGSSPQPTALGLPAVGTWANIHPARTPGMCVTDGRDRTGSYDSPIAAQRPCEESQVPHVYLEPVDKDTVQIQWHHPKMGIGCLTVMPDGPGRDMLEPRDDCQNDNTAQQFRLELVGPPADPLRVRIRAVVSERCLGMRDQDTAYDTEVVQLPCADGEDQEFLIERIYPP